MTQSYVQCISIMGWCPPHVFTIEGSSKSLLIRVHISYCYLKYFMNACNNKCLMQQKLIYCLFQIIQIMGHTVKNIKRTPQSFQKETKILTINELTSLFACAPTYSDVFIQVYQTLLSGNGPLPETSRYFLAIKVSFIIMNYPLFVKMFFYRHAKQLAVSLL